MRRIGLPITRFPIHLAPMGGGTSTPALCAAVSNSGGLGSLGSAYQTPKQIKDSIAEVRRLTDRPFAVNLFAVDAPPASALKFSSLKVDPKPMLDLLASYHAELGLAPPTVPDRASQIFDEQVEAVLSSGVDIDMFTFTFGIPSRYVMDSLHRAGICVAGTATSIHEARLLAEAGCDAIIAQGKEAGAHRGTFIGDVETKSLVPIRDLVRGILAEVKLPVIAAGGLMNGFHVREVLDLGAAAAMMGTAFLVCPESGAAQVHKRAILAVQDGKPSTVLTRAYTGRPARGLPNRFMLDVESRIPDPTLPFPWQNAITRPMRAAAGRKGVVDMLSLWAGENAGMAREMPASDLVATLAREAKLAE